MTPQQRYLKRYGYLIIVGPPAFAFGLYEIYRFAVGSRERAIFVGTLFTVYVIGSLIWVYVIYPRLKGGTLSPQALAVRFMVGMGLILAIVALTLRSLLPGIGL